MISIITVAVISIITFLVGIVSGIRILYISKRKVNFFTIIHFLGIVSVSQYFDDILLLADFLIDFN